MQYNKSVINWDEISRRLTGDPTNIRSTYTGFKYSKQVKRIRLIEHLLNKITGR